MKTAEEWSRDNFHFKSDFELRLKIRQVQLDARAELEQQNTMLRNVLSIIQYNYNDERKTSRCQICKVAYGQKHTEECSVGKALSIPPPAQQWVRKEEYDEVVRQLENIQQ